MPFLPSSHKDSTLGIPSASDKAPDIINTPLPPRMPAETRMRDLETALRTRHPELTVYAIHDMSRAIYRRQLEESAVTAMQACANADKIEAVKTEQGSSIHFKEDSDTKNMVDDFSNQILGYDDDGCAIVDYEGKTPVICDEDGWRCIKTVNGLFYPSSSKKDGVMDGWNFNPKNSDFAGPQSFKLDGSLAYPLDVLPDAGMLLFAQTTEPVIARRLEQENILAAAEAADEPATPSSDDDNAEYVKVCQPQFLSTLDNVKPLADFKDEVAFPMFANLPYYDAGRQSAPYIVDGAYERHWCMLAEITFISDVAPEIIAKDRACQEFRLWMAFLENGEWADQMVCVGDTIAIMYAESYEWSQEQDRLRVTERYVRAVRRDEMAILPLRMDELITFSDEVQKTVRPGDGLVCGGCGHVGRLMQMMKCNDCNIENFCNTRCRGYSMLKGHKKDCENMALMSGFFKLDWGRYRYHAKFPL